MVSRRRSRDWSLLIPELLGLTLERLEYLPDWFSFGSVCKAWHQVTSQKLQGMNLSSDIPLLLVPGDDDGIDDENRSLYNVADGKILPFKLKIPYKKRLCGSSHGWLIGVNDDLGLTLSNPCSPTARTITLPPIENRDLIKRDFTTPQYKYGRPIYVSGCENYYRKVIMSSDPSLNSTDCVVAAIYGYDNWLAFIKPGDESWTHVKISEEPYLKDLMFHKGMLYVVDGDGQIISVYIDGTKDSEDQPKRRNLISLEPDPDYAESVYIVESRQGSIFMVKRHLKINDNHTHMVTYEFQVFKLIDKIVERYEWNEIKSIEHDQALFVGDNHSMTISTISNAVIGESIYFTSDYVDFSEYLWPSTTDMGVFNLKDGSFKTHYNVRPKHHQMPTAIWISIMWKH